MRQHRTEIVFLCSTCVLLGAAFLFTVHAFNIEFQTHIVGSFRSNPEVTTKKEMGSTSDRVLIVGDLMLARAVERTMLTYDATYPFQFMNTIFNEHAYQVANFEAAIPKTHVPTRDMTFQFSVREAFAATLAEYGFTHVSLANNHSTDFGLSGYTNTKQVLREHNIEPFGVSQTVNTESLSFIETENGTITILGLDYTLGTPENSAVQALLEKANSVSDVVIVYVHWGTEYAPAHSHAQSALAHFYAENGVDLVVGQHPHVVQDIEMIGDTLVFYSLGNFIFDQYFNVEVQEGLVLSLNPATRTIELIPVTTLGSRMAPQPMPEVEQTLFLRALAKKSDPTLKDTIESGIISF